MTAKEFFKSVYDAEKAVADLKAQRAHYMDVAINASAPLDAQPHSSGASGGRVERAAVDMVDVDQQIAAKIDEYKRLFVRAAELIEGLERPNQRRVMRLRYLCGMSWKAITEEMGYTDEKSAYRVHGWALKEIGIVE